MNQDNIYQLSQIFIEFLPYECINLLLRTSKMFAHLKSRITQKAMSEADSFYMMYIRPRYLDILSDPSKIDTLVKENKGKPVYERLIHNTIAMSSKAKSIPTKSVSPQLYIRRHILKYKFDEVYVKMKKLYCLYVEFKDIPLLSIRGLLYVNMREDFVNLLDKLWIDIYKNTMLTIRNNYSDACIVINKLSLLGVIFSGSLAAAVIMDNIEVVNSVIKQLKLVKDSKQCIIVNDIIINSSIDIIQILYFEKYNIKIVYDDLIYYLTKNTDPKIILNIHELLRLDLIDVDNIRTNMSTKHKLDIINYELIDKIINHKPVYVNLINKKRRINVTQ